MAQSFPESDRRRLEHELTTSTYSVLLRTLQVQSAEYRRFSNWYEVLAFMHTGSSSDPRKDGILRPLFTGQGKHNDPRCRTVLLVIFWPGLESMFRKKHYWDPDDEARWSNITWAFLQTVCRIDVERRPERLTQKIIGDTIHRLYEEYQREWQRAGRQTHVEDEREFERLAGGCEALEMAAVDLFDAKAAEARQFEKYRSLGVISEKELFLAVGTIVYGTPLREYASEAGISYEAAKKRRQRLDAKIRRYREKP